MKFIEQHETTRDMFPLSKYNNRRIFDLANPLLPPQTPFQNQDLWIDLPHPTKNAAALVE